MDHRSIRIQQGMHCYPFLIHINSFPWEWFVATHCFSSICTFGWSQLSSKLHSGSSSALRSPHRTSYMQKRDLTKATMSEPHFSLRNNIRHDFLFFFALTESGNETTMDPLLFACSMKEKLCIIVLIKTRGENSQSQMENHLIPSVRSVKFNCLAVRSVGVSIIQIDETLAIFQTKIV